MNRQDRDAILTAILLTAATFLVIWLVEHFR